MVVVVVVVLWGREREGGVGSKRSILGQSNAHQNVTSNILGAAILRCILI